jgi:hypothetical protein
MYIHWITFEELLVSYTPTVFDMNTCDISTTTIGTWILSLFPVGV